jgi:hypothetical protein
VWVLSDRLTAYTLSMTVGQTAGLNPDLLEQALLYELEGVTGVSTVHKSLAFHSLGEEDGLSHYWVCAAPNDLFERLRLALKKRGGKLAGLGHPCGMAASLRGQTGPWLRFEYWRDIVLGLYVDAKGRKHMQAFATSLSPSKRRIAVDRWQAGLSLSTMTPETLAMGAFEDLIETDFEHFMLNDAEVLHRWLALSAVVLATNEDPPVPLILPGPRPELEYLIIGGVAMGVLLLCLSHFAWNRWQQTQMEAEITTLNNLEANIKSSGDAIKKKQTERTKLNEEVQTSSALSPAMVGQIFDVLRQRQEGILKVLAENRSDHLVIEEIGHANDQVTVKGVVLKADEANRLRSSLEVGLRSLAWQVKAPVKTDLNYFADGGPWQFEIKLKDLGLQGFTATPSTGTKPPVAGNRP